MTPEQIAARERAQALTERIDAFLSQPRDPAVADAAAEMERLSLRAMAEADERRRFTEPKPKPLPARAMARTDAGYIHRAHKLDGRRK